MRLIVIWAVVFLLLPLGFVWALEKEQGVIPSAMTPTKGPDHASITMITYTDFLSPASANAAKTIDEVVKKYPEDILLLSKPYPSLANPNAILVHEAAISAGEQGKFWEMRDLLFAHKGTMTQAALLNYAKQLKLNTKQFLSDLETHRFKNIILQQMQEAKGFGVNNAPTFFINGRKLIGARSVSDLKQVIDDALGLRPIQPLPTPKAEASPQPQAHAPAEVVTIDTAGAYSMGHEDALVVIVEFSDFQCPFCARAVQTMKEVMKRYPTQVRWAFKHFPLDFHADSRLAHAASLAAGAQGKFWEMHDFIFSGQQAMKRDDLLTHAKALGLDMERFTKEMDSGQYQAIIDKDVQEGQRLGVNGTPTSFVNGQRLVGARPIEDIVRMIEGQIK